jgi:hypothetical protein
MPVELSPISLWVYLQRNHKEGKGVLLRSPFSQSSGEQGQKSNPQWPKGIKKGTQQNPRPWVHSRRRRSRAWASTGYAPI